MQAIIENFRARPLHHKVIAWILSLIFLTGLFWLYFYKNQWEKFQELSERAERLDSEIFEANRKAKQLPKFLEETARLDKQLERVVLQLPDKKEIQALLSSISTLATDTGLEVIKVTPQREAHKDFYAEVPMYIEVEGSFHQLATFFDEVGHLPRIVNINEVSVDIVTETKDEVVVRSSCMITSFRYLDEAERIQKPQTQQPGRGARKRRSA